MKVAVCDDNREFCEKERTTIKDVFKQYFQGEDCQVDIYNDGQTIISNYSDNAYDMVFLDLELGDENGFDIAEQIVLMNNDAIIIFVTSHENLVYEAFRFRPLGYIVKDRFDREFTRMMVKIVDKLIKMRQVIELGGEKFYVDRVVSIATQKRKICVKSLKGEILLVDSYSKHVAELEKYGFVQSSKAVLITGCMCFVRKLPLMCPFYKHSAVRVGFGHRFLNRSSSGTSFIFVIIVIVDFLTQLFSFLGYLFAKLFLVHLRGFGDLFLLELLFIRGCFNMCSVDKNHAWVYHPVVQCFVQNMCKNFFTQLRGKAFAKGITYRCEMRDLVQ